MNWLDGVREAIDYIEANLTGELTIEKVAAKAYSSSAYFQKSFALLCGFTVGTYIRNRRLSCAGNDLLSSDEKVIDIAVKYGYASADSFTRAFTRFHGATPTAVREQGRPVKTYAPLQLELFMKGGYIMDYRLQKQKAFRAKVKIDHENKTVWLVKGKRDDFDLFTLERSLSDEYPGYAVKRTDAGTVENADGLTVVFSPDVLWAVFSCRGTTRDGAREDTIKKIMTEWFPQTEYEPLFKNAGFIHIYSMKDSGDFGEIRIPVKEKKR